MHRLSQSATDERWTSIVAALRLTTELDTADPEFHAVSRLRQSYVAIVNARPDGGTLVPTSPVRKSRDSNATFGGGPFSLPPIYVIVSPTAYLIDSFEFQREAKHRFDYEITPKVEYYTSEECAEASEFYIAKVELLNEMNDIGELMDETSDRLLSYLCENVPDKPLCIDFFIMNSRADIFAGDDRYFQPDAGIGNSRAHVYINPQTLEWEVKINSTRIDIAGVYVRSKQDSARLFRTEDVKVEYDANGHITAKVKFFNNFCPTRTGCPAINATFHFTPDASQPGGYAAHWVRDGFPSVGIYMRKLGGGWHTLAEDEERIKKATYNWWALKDGLLQSLNMPPGCNIQ